MKKRFVIECVVLELVIVGLFTALCGLVEMGYLPFDVDGIADAIMADDECSYIHAVPTTTAPENHPVNTNTAGKDQ
jgi:hypothetical protein